MLARMLCATACLVAPSTVLACSGDDLARSLPVTDVVITEIGDGNIYLSAVITNNLAFTVGDFALTTSVLAEGRDAPIAQQDRPAHGLIAGGLMPGEAMEFDDWVHVGDRGVRLAQEAASLSVSMQVIAAADAELRYLLSDGDPYAGWQDQRSPHRCAQ